jgi:hypothetical protein
MTPERTSAPLVCPTCAQRHPSHERFCTRCGMPLVHEGAPVAEAPASDAHERARKIRPEYTRGELVRVAGGRNQAEAELIQNLLLEEGIPSTLRRTAGFDVPDFLAAGPRDVMVAASAIEPVRSILREAELVDERATEATAPTARQAATVLAGILGGGALAALIAWALLGAGG